MDVLGLCLYQGVYRPQEKRLTVDQALESLGSWPGQWSKNEETTHDWEWFIPPIYGELGDGLFSTYLWWFGGWFIIIVVSPPLFCCLRLAFCNGYQKM